MIELIPFKIAFTAVFFIFLMVVDELFMRIDDAGKLSGVTYCWPLRFGCKDIWSIWEAVFVILLVCFLLGVWLP